MVARSAVETTEMEVGAEDGPPGAAEAAGFSIREAGKENEVGWVRKVFVGTVGVDAAYAITDGQRKSGTPSSLSGSQSARMVSSRLPTAFVSAECG